MKPLDMADKYDHLHLDEDDEPTVRMQTPSFMPQVIVEKSYPGVGIVLALGFGLLFWGTLAYFIFR